MDKQEFTGDSKNRSTVLLTSYQSGAERGNNLGTCGYSYDIVAAKFQPLLKEWGHVTVVRQPESRLQKESDNQKARGFHPVHVGFLPFHHATLATSVPNVLVPAWEFPDIPDHPFDDDPRQNWVAMANRCELVLVGGPFTKQSFIRAGIRIPIEIVPVPLNDSCFAVPPWNLNGPITLDISAYEFTQAATLSMAKKSSRWSAKAVAKRTLQNIKRTYKRSIRPHLPPPASFLITGLAVLARELRSLPSLPRRCKSLQLEGVVYTSIFNPMDGRKNWEDLISGFLLALGDRHDATLILKLVGSSPAAASKVLEHYRRLNLPHRCRLIIITDFLSTELMHALMQASTYYVTTTRAEGNCLPLMDYLAAGRPAITPSHTAIGDYFQPEFGFTVDSHVEPAAWPHDPALRCRTSWHRLVWPSLVAQFHESYAVAQHQPARYAEMGERARDHMRKWAGINAVRRRLHRALDLTTPATDDAVRRAA